MGTLLLCFIHGFSGDDDTFHQFPQQLRDATQELVPEWVVKSAVYPKYETKGDLPSCVARFREWLQNHLKELESETQSVSADDSRSVKTILVAHSMGGFVAADAILSIANDETASASGSGSIKLPIIHGLLAMDTPFLGIASPMLAYSAFSQFSKVSNAYRLMSMLPSSFLRGNDPQALPAQQTSSAPQTSNRRTAWELGALPAWRTIAAYAGTTGTLAAAGVAAYMNREELFQGYEWLKNHLQFVGVIMKREESRLKLARITALEGFGFANLYTSLGQNSPMAGGSYVPQRTFCALPPADNPLSKAFLKELNLVAKDEIDAHTSMFEEARNPGYHRLVNDAKELVAEWAQRDFGHYKTHDLEQKTTDAMDSRTSDNAEAVQEGQAKAESAGTEESAGSKKVDNAGDVPSEAPDKAVQEGQAKAESAGNKESAGSNKVDNAGDMASEAPRAADEERSKKKDAKQAENTSDQPTSS